MLGLQTEYEVRDEGRIAYYLAVKFESQKTSVHKCSENLKFEEHKRDKFTVVWSAIRGVCWAIERGLPLHRVKI
jgi:hypothetical protein